MAIEKINIQKFTVFKDIAIKFSEGINVFIGENGTGKTHLLKLLYAHCANIDNTEIYDGFDFYVRFLPQYFGENVKSSNYVMDRLLKSSYNITWRREEVNQSLFIPAKEMLSISKIAKINERFKKELSMDKTLTDIIKKALNLKPDNIPEIAKTIVPKLEKHIDGKIFVEEDDSFWVLKNNGDKIPFTMEAEGIRKLGLLWQLLMNENITKGSVLLWDEPEANLNPKLIPDLVEILLELSRNGVQIFLATHDYILAKYFEVRRKENDSVLFHSLYKDKGSVQCESNVNFRDLKNNSIISSFDKLLDEVYFANVED